MATTQTTDRISFLRGLRQVRQFRPDPVPAAALDDILEVARWSGSGMNAQPWSFVVVDDGETLRALAAANPNAGFIGDAPAAVVIVMNGAWAGEPFDEGRLAERLLLAAAAHGLGAGIGWTAGDGAETKRLLDIPAKRTVRTLIGLGFPAAGIKRRPGQARKPIEELVHRGRFRA